MIAKAHTDGPARYNVSCRVTIERMCSAPNETA